MLWLGWEGEREGRGRGRGENSGSWVVVWEEGTGYVYECGKVTLQLSW